MALTYGQSITDGCIDWNATASALNLLADAVAARRHVQHRDVQHRNAQHRDFRERSA
jgi:3-deoxy-7-phosphoheptulonate synthase